MQTCYCILKRLGIPNVQHSLPQPCAPRSHGVRLPPAPLQREQPPAAGGAARCHAPAPCARTRCEHSAVLCLAALPAVHRNRGCPTFVFFSNHAVTPRSTFASRPGQRCRVSARCRQRRDGRGWRPGQQQPHGPTAAPRAPTAGPRCSGLPEPSPLCSVPGHAAPHRRGLPAGAEKGKAWETARSVFRPTKRYCEPRAAPQEAGLSSAEHGAARRTVRGSGTQGLLFGVTAIDGARGQMESTAFRENSALSLELNTASQRGLLPAKPRAPATFTASL